MALARRSFRGETFSISGVEGQVLPAALVVAGILEGIAVNQVLVLTTRNDDSIGLTVSAVHSQNFGRSMVHGPLVACFYPFVCALSGVVWLCAAVGVLFCVCC